MREGKISQAVLDRSVIRSIKSSNENIIKGPHIGSDFSLMSMVDNSTAAVASRTIVLKEQDDLKFGFYHLVNHVSCAGCVLQGIVVSILFPQEAAEDLLKSIMKTLDLLCGQTGMSVIGGNTTVSEAVQFPVISLTCLGFSNNEKNEKKLSKQDIVIVNHVGVEGTLRAVNKYRDKLLEKLPERVLNEACKFEKELMAVNEAVTAFEAGAASVHTVGEGGIFAALWEFAFEAKTGLEVDLKKIPIHQETVEICEILGVNPYEFMSTGSLIVTTDNGEELCRIMGEKGMYAVVCGHTDSSNDRVITNEDEKRHLVPAVQDYIYKI